MLGAWGCLVLGVPGSRGVPGPRGVSRPTTKGKLRGIWSRPTTKGGVEGNLIQAHASYWNAFLFVIIHGFHDMQFCHICLNCQKYITSSDNIFLFLCVPFQFPSLKTFWRATVLFCKVPETSASDFWRRLSWLSKLKIICKFSHLYGLSKSKRSILTNST